MPTPRSKSKPKIVKARRPAPKLKAKVSAKGKAKVTPKRTATRAAKPVAKKRGRRPPMPPPMVVPPLTEASFRLGDPGEKDDLAEMLGEAAVQSMTGGAQAAEEFRDEELTEEKGGPFVETSADTEFAYDFEKPIEGEPAPFPVVSPQT